MTQQDPIARINDLRRKVLSGGHLSTDEVKEALDLLRASRAATQSDRTSTKRAKPQPIDLDALFAPAKEGDGK